MSIDSKEWRIFFLIWPASGKRKEAASSLPANKEKSSTSVLCFLKEKSMDFWREKSAWAPVTEAVEFSITVHYSMKRKARLLSMKGKSRTLKTDWSSPLNKLTDWMVSSSQSTTPASPKLNSKDWPSVQLNTPNSRKNMLGSEDSWPVSAVFSRPNWTNSETLELNLKTRPLLTNYFAVRASKPPLPTVWWPSLNIKIDLFKFQFKMSGLKIWLASCLSNWKS